MRVDIVETSLRGPDSPGSAAGTCLLQKARAPVAVPAAAGDDDHEPADGRTFSASVIGDTTFRATSRIRSLTPELAKGLEFDLVVLIDPEAFGNGIEGTVDHYVAMTRATQQLVILTSS